MGITPAPAGNRQKHIASLESILGSPPPLRGTVAKSFCSTLIFRITPAPAGNSFDGKHFISTLEDHPRPCGEQIVFRISLTKSLGSPPPLRGTVLRFSRNVFSVRITPAPAGNRDQALSIAIEFGDHPRPCGEQVSRSGHRIGKRGSPPPLRGTASFCWFIRRSNRITPAPAGNRLESTSPVIPYRDHPRPCGEQNPMLGYTVCRLGSPPPLRGTEIVVQIGMLLHRITPAPAGNSLSSHCSFAAARDHPRPCGEQIDDPAPIEPTKGSPPPLRGTAEKPEYLDAVPGITPAPAGNSSIPLFYYS